MKRIDKLIISSFLGPFILTLVVVVFILLTQHMLKYFDDIVGKDLGWGVLAQLLFYFAVFMTPTAIPLAVLLSSLMTFGNLGEHFELTAIKSAGISLLRALFPIFIFVCGLTVIAFYSNNYFVPKAALEAYSLLYDIKQKKPALDLKKGAFYNGIPDFSIKVEDKSEDGKTIKDIIMYDHRNSVGNKKVILADSGLMYTVNNDRYLKLELFDGNFYFEDSKETGAKRSDQSMARSSFERSEYVLDLSSFGLDRTDKSLFEGNRIMRNLDQLTRDVDSVTKAIGVTKMKVFDEPKMAFFYHLKEDTVPMPADLLAMKKTFEEEKLKEKIRKDSVKSIYAKPELEENNKPIDSSSFKYVKELKDEDIASVSPNKTKSKSKNNSLVKKKNDNKSRVKNRPKNKTPRKTKNIKNPKPNSKKVEITERVSQNTRNKLIAGRSVVDWQKKFDINDTLSHEEIIAYMEEKRDAKDLMLLQSTLNNVRQAKTKIQSYNATLEREVYDKNVFAIQYHKIIANSVACIMMFLIGAPLGAIIKRGGLGMPVLLSILFFIIYYVISMTGEKYAKQNIIDPFLAIWMANFVLLPVGLLFLRQARNDVRLFEADFYNVIFDRIKTWFKRGKISKEIAG